MAPAAAPQAAFAAEAGTVVDGAARFQVLTPTLVRLEHAADGRFEDRPSLNVVNRSFRGPRFSARRARGVLTIRTSRMTLRYRRGSGPFSASNLTVRLRVGPSVQTLRPSFPATRGPDTGPPALEVSPYTVKEVPDYDAPTAGNLGGWYRALDLAGGPVELHDGLLSRDGWYVLDDSATALLQDAPPGFAPRPEHEGEYQDGYLFGYGHDYARGLRDLRLLTGAAPLLPRGAFGVWFSRYHAYRQSDYPELLARFREERVPLHVLMVDTDFKSPHAWNGWDWFPSLFDDPAAFFRWAHGEGLAVSLNTHPSITVDDPRLPDAERVAGGPLPDDPSSGGGTRCRTFVTVGDAYGRGTPGTSVGCKVFDWTRAGDQAAYFSLHEPFERQGVDFWWLDWCCDESYSVAPGLTQDAWINQLYARRNFARGSRWPVLSRVGSSVFDPDADRGGIWAEHRNAIHFTGDARPIWTMLDFQTTFTASEGSAGIPYVSHDIGGFGSVTSDGTAGRHLADDLYVRWVQSGAFQPILRLHSDHGDRLPWDYTGKAREVSAEFLRLRGALVPYVYTLAREAHDRGLPIARRSYLLWPEHDDAYSADHQYMLGSQLLVAPVGSPGDPATKDVWFPPGRWVDFFTGQVHRGPRVRRLSVPLERMPVFARAGAVIPLQQYRPTDTTPPDSLVVEAFPGRRGAFTLYEDEGDGPVSHRGRFARTRIAQRRDRRGTVVTIGAARGTYAGRPVERSYELRVRGTARPRRVTLSGRRLPRAAPGAELGWWYVTSRRTVVVNTGRLSTDSSARVVMPGAR